jgi:peptide/nickel transport system substrate-binding protein
MLGHPTAPCPYHDPSGAPDVSKAKALVKRAGLVGTPVTVWGENVSPRRQFTDYMVQVLDSIGFNAQEKLLAGSVYFTTLENTHTQAQIGFGDWGAFYPDPSQMFQPFETAALKASSTSNGDNFDYVSDSQIDRTVTQLAGDSGAQSATAASQWSALDQYAVKQAYYAVLGYSEFPKFFSDRIDFGAAIFSPAFGIDDFSSFALR